MGEELKKEGNQQELQGEGKQENNTETVKELTLEQKIKKVQDLMKDSEDKIEKEKEVLKEHKKTLKKLTNMQDAINKISL
jgi:hypothetical protein